MDSPINVLVVDDENDFLYTMSYWLKSKGYNVLSATNGKEAVDKVKNNPVDIMFLDLNMPVMDGAEALKRIRHFNKNVPVVIITAYTVDDRVSEVEKYGISGFFSKEKDFSESAMLIESILRLHKDIKDEKNKPSS